MKPCRIADTLWRKISLAPSRPSVRHCAMAKQFRLADHSIIGFVATSDPERAKEFYGEKLALPLIEEQMPFALVYDAHGTMLRVTIVKEVRPAAYTVLGWKVPDIGAAANRHDRLV